MNQIKNLRNVIVVNCTPHQVHLLMSESFIYDQIEPEIKITFPLTKWIARVNYRTDLIERIIVNNIVVDVTSTKYTTVMGLPKPMKDHIYIVSKIVAEALYDDRDDLYILSGFARDVNGKILGGRSLAKLNPIRP